MNLGSVGRIPSSTVEIELLKILYLKCKLCLEFNYYYNFNIQL